MNKDKNLVSTLLEEIEKYGREILLPQNLPDDIFKRLVEEINDLDENKTESESSSILFLCIMMLKHESKITHRMEIIFKEDELLDYYNMYTICIRLEDMRRNGKVQITNDSFPTLENIFDKNRSIEVIGLDEHIN